MFPEPGPPEEDELYEMYMADTNKVYSVEGETLKELPEFCKSVPTYGMLHEKLVRMRFPDS